MPPARKEATLSFCHASRSVRITTAILVSNCMIDRASEGFVLQLNLAASTTAARPLSTESFRDGPKDQTSDVQLHIGKSRDSGFDASHRPGKTIAKAYPLASQAQARITHSLPPDS
jgi:hypothetical protein